MTTLVFTEKLGVLPDRVFEAMFNDRLVAKGTILQIITDIFACYMQQTKGGADDLVALLSKAKVADRLLEYFPPGQQTEAAFTSHFEKAGMPKLVRPSAPLSYVARSSMLLRACCSCGSIQPHSWSIDLLRQLRAAARPHGAAARLQVEWQTRKLRENNVVQLQERLQHLFAEEAGVEAYRECVAEYSATVPGENVVRVIWTSLVGSINQVGKNQMQLLQMILKAIKQNKALLQEHTTSLKLELALLNCIQVTCYEDSKLLKVRPHAPIALCLRVVRRGDCKRRSHATAVQIFVDLVKHLYNADIIAEDTINYWYKKGSVARGRNVFLTDIQPFVKWLEEAEEDEDDEEEE